MSDDPHKAKTLDGDQEKCTHQARNGRHEEYARPDGSSFCRACGVELGFWKDVTQKPKAARAPCPNERKTMEPEDKIEAMIQAAGKTAPRLTPADIDAAIVAEYSFTAAQAAEGCPQHPSLACLTICVLVLRNGFTVTGESACASPENFDAAIGHKIAREKARDKIWALEGYRLKSELAAIAG